MVSSRRPAHRAPHAIGALGELVYDELANALSDVAPSHARGTLVDIGCGRKPWARLFAPYVDAHIGVDHPASPTPSENVDVLASAYAIPLPDGSADTVLMTEVLEHLERPVEALAEAHRLLAPGGALIVTTPLLWPVHEAPRDFFRYTPFGLEHVIIAAGFRDVAVRPLSGQWATLAALRSYSLRRYRRGPLRPLIDLYARAHQRLAVRLDELDFRDDFSWNHLAVARRPGHEPSAPGSP